MAEDGLLVNFAIPEGFLAPKTKLQGGTWRQRRQIRQIQKHNDSRSSRDANPNHIRTGETSIEDAGLSVKRQKIDTAPDFRARYKPVQPQAAADPNRPFISSLFSKNPAAKTVFEDQPSAISDKPVEPSNAPLTSEQLNFTTLGLTPTIATHLTTKLSISAPTAIQKASLPPLLDNDDDAFIQAETGSGKTLAYLLPIVQRIMALFTTDSSAENALKRKSGLFAIILAPTRELSKQIYLVLESLLRCAHWIVPGIVIGGEKKKSEKARLRKGLNILVATPGRLADHLNNTEALDTSSVRWLVLDEGDRLMELGFEDDIKKIVNSLDFRLGKSQTTTMDSLPKKRVTILCSATMRGDVQRLGELSLKEAVHISADPNDLSAESTVLSTGNDKEQRFSVPAQLKQSYAIIPAKLRLVSLFATLKRTFTRCTPSTKAMVFVSCADSVDFHFQTLTKPVNNKLSLEDNDTANATNKNDAKFAAKGKNSTRDAHKAPPNPYGSKPAELKTFADSLWLSTKDHKVQVFRLHGSLQQSLRTSTLQAFTKCETPAVLICTDIASRGLDLPNVDRVIEYDPAFSREEHLHRIGRTARAGNDGNATIFLMPGCEEGYVEVLKAERGDAGAANIRGMNAEYVLKSGFPSIPQTSSSGRSNSSKKDELAPWEELATDFQLDMERWVSNDAAVLESARRAYQSHVRAYATHVKDERQWFDMQQLHLGHLAKAFALRDRPNSLNVPGLRSTPAKVKADRKKAGARSARTGNGNGSDVEDSAAVDLAEARKKMRSMSKMMSAGAGEFNLA